MIPSLADLRLRWRDLPRQDYEWSQYVYTDAQGYVVVRSLLSGSVWWWASRVMREDEQREHTYGRLP